MNGDAADANEVDRTDAERAVVLLSGGMDSATAAYEAVDRGYEPHVLHTSYGQRTERREYACARALAREIDAADLLHVQTGHLARIGASSLTDPAIEVPDADPGVEASDAASDREEVPSSYVPFRNANLLAMAVSYAEANGCTAVFVGAHSEDFVGYPDCRPAFFEAFQRVVDVGTRPDTGIEIVAPFVDWSKTNIAERGLELGVPYELTWSCYRDEAPACGACDSCVRRLEAFENLEVRDPIEYARYPQ